MRDIGNGTIGSETLRQRSGIDIRNGNTDTYITTLNVQLNAMDTTVHSTWANDTLSL